MRPKDGGTTSGKGSTHSPAPEMARARGRGGVGGPKERNGHLGSKGCQQQFDVLDAKPTQPTDVTANQDRGRERGGDYRKEQKHVYPEAVAFSRGSGSSSRRLAFRRSRKRNPTAAAHMRRQPAVTNTSGAPSRSLSGPAMAIPPSSPACASKNRLDMTRPRTLSGASRMATEIRGTRYTVFAAPQMKRKTMAKVRSRENPVSA